jgi:hypothetical protein
MSQILQVGGVFGKKEEKESSDVSSDTSEEEQESKPLKLCCTDESCLTCGGSALRQAQAERDKERRKLNRLKKKPDQLRKELFEVILRKRIFLTDRMERVEKALVTYGFFTETQLIN